MSNILKEYKKAIKIKYEIEKKGKYFDYLYSPSRGKLRDLCWLIFENNPTKDDLNVFRNLLSLDFDHTKKNKFKEKKDKFRPIETFFKGETDPSNIDAINLAAIMVDFHPRPFKKFHEEYTAEPAKKTAKTKKEVIEKEKLIDSKKSKTVLKKGNLFLNFAAAISKKIDEKIHPGRIITISGS
ncbi:hypothetical protein [Flavobacterium sp. JAS]|uniref:hypothetical protein n=1 Tax=Flavobacterium sp. JAS TaxID=2897329 RepID=UPI001E3D8428|nr:hypothetical protein [Flavobacterium sp. JAS]MCD0471528.1 hypothetical protein [Flavobacterium sp. JAS]